MKKLWIILLIITLFSCGMSNWIREDTNYWGDKKKSIKTVDTNNNDIKLELLFECDEFKVYRFIDMAHTRYVAVKKDSISTIEINKKNRDKNQIIEDNKIETK